MDRRSAFGIALVAVVSGCTTDPAPGPTSSGASVPTAADYAWFTEDEDNFLVNGFSFTWVRGVTPADVVTRLGGTTLWESDWEHLYTENNPEDFVAIAEVAGWRMVMDLAAGFGSNEAPLLTLSRGTTVVYQFLNVELDGIYRLVKDGTVHVEFEPYDPSSRQGSTPDELLEAMTKVGFDLNPSTSDDGDEQIDENETETAFALTEHLTGIRLSPALLEAQSYLLATVPAR